MDMNSIIIYLACLIVLFIVGKIFYVPLKHILKLLINSVLGGVLIYIVNIVGSSFNFHIGLNWVTAIFAGLLGVPGVIVLILVRILVGWFFKAVENGMECGKGDGSDFQKIGNRNRPLFHYSTVTDLAKFLGLSTSNPLFLEM